MRNFTEELDLLKILFEVEGSSQMAMEIFIKAFQMDKEFRKKCEPYDNFIWREHIARMGNNSDAKNGVSFSKIEMHQASQYHLLFGTAQSADHKVNAVFFYFTDIDKGLFNCANFHSSAMLLGQFSISGDYEKGEINLN
jgi:hypothetical protein